MKYFQFTEKEYQALIERLDAPKEKLSGNRQMPNDIIYNNVGALKIFKVCRRTLQQWPTVGIISFSQVGSKLYYIQKDISDFLESNYNDSFRKNKG